MLIPRLSRVVSKCFDIKSEMIYKVCLNNFKQVLNFFFSPMFAVKSCKLGGTCGIFVKKITLSKFFSCYSEAHFLVNCHFFRLATAHKTEDGTQFRFMLFSATCLMNLVWIPECFHYRQSTWKPRETFFCSDVHNENIFIRKWKMWNEKTISRHRG